MTTSDVSPGRRPEWWIAAAGIAVSLAAAALGVVVDIPGAPQPPLLTTDTGIATRLVAAGIAALGFGIAFARARVGGAVALVGGLAAGGLLAFHVPPALAIVVGGALVVPAVILVVRGWSGWATRLPVVVGVGVMTAAVGAVCGGAYDFFYGATHPESRVPGPPRGAVEWVWSGGVTATEAVVVAKLRDADAPAELQVGSPGARVVTERDREYVRFVVSGLRPGTRVDYTVRSGAGTHGSGAGRLRTMPTGPASFTVAFSSCARSGSNGAVFDAIRAEDPLLYLNLGDLFYANIDSPDVGRFARAFDHVLTRPAQANLARATSTAYVWDDHDFGPNDADGTSPSAPAAHRAFRTLVPHHPLALPGDAAPVARAFTVGRVRFIVTDGRSARSPADMPDGPDKTMLGTAQRRWFVQELRASRDSFAAIVWVNSVPWIGAAKAGGDGWAGYATERAVLADAIDANGIRNLVMISGDNHSVAIDDGTNSGYATSGGGGFPLIHAGALDRAPQTKGGPYSHGVFPGGGQFGTLRVDDAGGNRVTVTLRGLDWQRRELTSLRVTLPVGSRALDQ